MSSCHANIHPQTFIRRAGVLISKCNPLPDNVPPPPKSLEEVVCESPWLGPSPPESFKISAVAGQQTGKYRLWCYIPSGAFSAKIYRHKTSDHRLVTVGLEFFSDLENGSERNFLLGFRSLWTEYAKEVVFEDNEQITGVSFESDNHTVQVPLP